MSPLLRKIVAKLALRLQPMPFMIALRRAAFLPHLIGPPPDPVIDVHGRTFTSGGEYGMNGICLFLEAAAVNRCDFARRTFLDRGGSIRQSRRIVGKRSARIVLVPRLPRR